MKKTIGAVLVLFMINLLNAQQFSCDSVEIFSVQLSTINPTVEVVVKNSNADIISYPGFILFNTNLDTLAMESVNYFGIGTNYQTHDLTLLNSINLPFNGYLELHSWFYDSLKCTFPVAIDTIFAAIEPSFLSSVNVFPNPTNNLITLGIDGYNGPINVEVYDLQGKRLKTTTNTTISMEEFAKGIYVFKVAYGDIVEKLKVVKE